MRHVEGASRVIKERVKFSERDRARLGYTPVRGMSKGALVQAAESKPGRSRYIDMNPMPWLSCVSQASTNILEVPRHEKALKGGREAGETPSRHSLTKSIAGVRWCRSERIHALNAAQLESFTWRW